MIGKLSCSLGLHHYQSRAKSNPDISLWRRSPAQFFAKYTYMICQRCGKLLKEDELEAISQSERGCP